MDLNVAKVVALSVLGLGSIFFGLLPAALKEYNLRRRPTVETVLLCFGAGILLATSIVHMLTEVTIFQYRLFKQFISKKLSY